jgi:hypothetical protein
VTSFPVPPTATIEELLAAIRQGGEAASESALALGLLLEDRRPEDDIQIASVVGPELAARRLSRSERRGAVDGLITYVQDSPRPNPSAVWALVKSYEPRIVPVLISLLDATLDDQDAVPLAHQALIGIVNVGLTTTKYRAQGHAALERAAVRGHEEVAETARRYLARRS